MRTWLVRLVAALLVICACGRLHFEADETALTIIAPAQDSEVEATAQLTGTCRSGVAVTVGGNGLRGGVATPCTAGTFATTIAFSDGDGAKQVSVTQGTASVTRVVQRVSPARLRSSAVGSQGSAGPMIDCDLVIGRPSELAPGDLLFGMIYADSGTIGGAVSTPGFTRTGLDAFSHVAFWKFASATEPASYTFRIAAGIAVTDTCESAGVLVAFSGIGPAALLVESEVIDTDGAVAAPSVTTPKRGILVGAWGSNGPATGFTQTAMQVAAGVASTGDFASVLVAYQGVQVGETGPRTATLQQPRPAAAGLLVFDGKP